MQTPQMIASLLVAATAAQAAGPMIVQTPRGAKVQAVIDYPKEPGKAPALVIVPGSAYHMDLPLTRGLFDRAIQAGFVSVRFNWQYYGAKGQPSENLANEAEDLRAVIARVRQDPRVDTRRIYVAGKSLGSIVAYRVFREDPGLRGALLLTPIYRPDTNYYPDLANEKRPMVFLVGDRDEENCRLPLMYGALAASGQNAKVVVMAGDHGLEVAKDRGVNQPYWDQAIEMSTYWLRTFETRE